MVDSVEVSEAAAVASREVSVEEWGAALDAACVRMEEIWDAEDARIEEILDERERAEYAERMRDSAEAEADDPCDGDGFGGYPPDDLVEEREW